MKAGCVRVAVAATSKAIGAIALLNLAQKSLTARWLPKAAMLHPRAAARLAA
jgi:hypothetical protein